MGFLAKAVGLQTLSEVPVGTYSADVQPPSRSSAPAPVTTDRAVSLPSAYRAIQLIAFLGAMLPLRARRRGELVDPTPAFIAKPDPWRSRRSFVSRYLTNAATDGNNFLLKSYLPGTQQLAGVQLLNPHTTWVRWETSGGRRRKVYDGVDPASGKPRTWSTADVEHVWCGLELPGHDRALGPIEACRLALTGVLETRDYASGWFGTRDDDVPSGILTSDQHIDPQTGAQYRKVWNNPQGLDPVTGDPLPRSAGGPSVRILGKGLTYQPILLKPADAQWLEAQGFGVLEIARLWGLPAEYLEAAVEGSSLVYSSLPMLASRFLTTTLYPVYLAPLEDVLTELSPNGQEAYFDGDPLLRPDAKTRAEIDDLYLGAGVYDGEYVRERDRIDLNGRTPAPITRPERTPVQ